MPAGYRIIINVFGDSNTGHVNVSFVGPDGSNWGTQTYGNNTSNGVWGVRDESSSLSRNPATTIWDVSYEQFTSAWNMVQTVINGPDNNYGLFGQNCVDFVRAVMDTAGLGQYVGSLFQDLGLAVNAYAHITDWLIANGFGGIASGIGEFLGNVGELGNAIVGLAGDAWNFGMDMAGAAWGFVESVASAVGGFASSVWGSITDFFRGFGKGNDGGEYQEEVAQHRSAAANDDADGTDGGYWSADAEVIDGDYWSADAGMDWASESAPPHTETAMLPQRGPFAPEAANDDHYSQGDWMFA